MDWNDLRFLLAVNRASGLKGAARALGTNPSTVYRRLEALEGQLGVQLFERRRGGYRPTTIGALIAERAQRIEGETLAIERQVIGADRRLEGQIRVSTNEAFGSYLLPPLLAEFRKLHPRLHITLSVNNQNVDLTRRDADIVVRASDTKPVDLVGKPVGSVGYASYAARSYLDRVGRGRPLGDYEWLVHDLSKARPVLADWMGKHVPESRNIFACDSLTALIEAASQEMGCCILPCFTAARFPVLEQLPGTYLLTDIAAWVLTHSDMRKSARVRAFIQFFSARLAADSDRLSGRAWHT
ncbi:LysR family transcriptional regulator [Panacagrimonas sp.]|uniref:LysR family transcriptional regulator n=1 Tax=Panacagrimonas sp. TaxID=2480088 RepID=UPI003B52B5CA